MLPTQFKTKKLYSISFEIIFLVEEEKLIISYVKKNQSQITKKHLLYSKM